MESSLASSTSSITIPQYPSINTLIYYELFNALSMLPGFIIATWAFANLTDCCVLSPMGYMIMCFGSMCYHGHNIIELINNGTYKTTAWPHRLDTICQQLGMVTYLLCYNPIWKWSLYIIIAMFIATWPLNISHPYQKHIIHAVNACAIIYISLPSIPCFITHILSFILFLVSYKIDILHGFFHFFLHFGSMFWWLKVLGDIREYPSNTCDYFTIDLKYSYII